MRHLETVIAGSDRIEDRFFEVESDLKYAKRPLRPDQEEQAIELVLKQLELFAIGEAA